MVGDVDAALARLRAAFPGAAEIQVAEDPYGGWRFLVVDESLTQVPSVERRRIATAALDDITVARLDLFTREEAELFGVTQVSSAMPDDLPLWPERLALAEGQEIQVRLPSSESLSLSSPVVATFYSLRGGVGRSTALAHAAQLLAVDHRVVCIDMDLEAPGLASLLNVESEVGRDQGVVSLLFQADLSGEMPDVAEHLIRIQEHDSLYLLPAGRPSADYARQLGQLDPSSWYREPTNPLRLLIDAVSQLDLQPEIVLIDARTGISAMSGPLLFDVADLALITFFPHPQAQLGTRALTRAILASRSRRVDGDSHFTPEPRFIISPLPSIPDARARYEDRALGWIEEWLAPARDTRGEKPFSDLDEITQTVLYAEDVAVTDSATGDLSMGYSSIAGWIASFVTPDRRTRTLADPPRTPEKLSVLESLRFTTGTAESQTDDDFSRTFLETETIARALRLDLPLVIGRKGTGKTALLRKLALGPRSRVVTSPTGISTHKRWMPESETYAALDRLTGQEGIGWRSIWPCLIAIVLALHEDISDAPDWVERELLCLSDGESGYSNSSLIADVSTLLGSPESPLKVWDWLERGSAHLPDSILLLFDGLDTGFGLEPEDLDRRRNAIAGLVSFFMARGDQLPNLQFKILLREDIWRQINVANKSHLFGRQVRLAWEDQTDYIRVAVKQAVQSRAFTEYLIERLVAGRAKGFDVTATDVDYWPEFLVYEAWTVLVGERVSGGKTAFTYNWAWNRLSDANDDHSPRALLQLLSEAANREQRLERVNSYERSIMRPRAMVESLDEVSEQAFEALREEFLELGPMFEALELIGRTPFAATELQIDSGLEGLALEVGLLGVDLGTRDDIERFRVPELYRKALHMTRRGQA